MESDGKVKKISVIIPTRNRVKDVMACIKSISIQTKLPDEVIVVDSSKTQELRNKLKNIRNLNIKYVYNNIFDSSSFQKNLGAKKSSGDILVFSDDDTVWSPTYLKELLSTFDKFPESGAVTGSPILKKKIFIKKVLNSFVNFFCFFFFLPIIGNGKFRLTGFPKIFSIKVNEIRKCEFIYGFGMAFRRKIFEEFEFDKHMEGYCWGDDDDIAYRISRKYPIYYNPFAKILHNKTASEREDNYLKQKKTVEYYRYLFKKNIPQDFLHEFAFWWSLVGIFILTLVESIIKINFTGVNGFFAGLKNILKGGRL